MLSILIPVYNYNALPLVQEIHQQLLACNINFEILIFDDNSSKKFPENKQINLLSYCEFRELPENIGRSSIRNLLAKNARYDRLLFIDSGTFPKSKNFIKNYLNYGSYQVITGGMTYLETPPKKPYKLRWLYTKKRESVVESYFGKQLVVCSSNFVIEKSIFETVSFDESLKNYGCEDVLFFDSICQYGINIKHIDNPVVHDSKDDADTFIKKTELAIENLSFLINEHKISKNRYFVSKLYFGCKKIKIDKIVSVIFLRTQNLLKKNFNSSYPLLFCYDFYRLGYFCYLKNRD